MSRMAGYHQYGRAVLRFFGEMGALLLSITCYDYAPLKLLIALTV
jgi:hypothetical protein